MISYIIIGRNEGWKLELCLQSVIRTITENRFIGGEIIYVDSASTDTSIEIAKQYKADKVVLLTGDCSAPIARNTGVSVSGGEILFFIDGDMEIESSFLKHIINHNNQLSYDFVGGYYINKNYDENWKYIGSDQFPPKSRLKNDYFEASTGGLFVIARKQWDQVGGMKNYFRGGEDPDLAFRLAKAGVFKLRKKELMAIHHTQNAGRSAGLKSLFSKRAMTGRIMLYRENITSIHALRRMIRNEYSVFFLILFLVALGFSFIAGMILGTLYLAILVARSVKRRNNPIWALIIKDVIFIFGFLFYWPDKGVNISYEVL